MLLAKNLIIWGKYTNFANVFLKKLAKILLKQTTINLHIIKLEADKQQSYSSVYSLDLVDLKTFKTNIKTNLVNNFFRLLKSLASAFILFIHQLNGNLHLCIYYWGSNNLIIKNQYLLSLIGKALYWLGQAKYFMQLDLTNAYY